MDYKELARKILPLVGGVENITKYTNCMTRLRIDIVDESLVDDGKLKEIDGVMGVVTGSQVQIILGPGHAPRAVEGMKALLLENGDNEKLENLAKDTRDKIKSKQTSSLQRGLKSIGNIFIPIIPGFVACGLIIAIGNIFKGIGLATDAPLWAKNLIANDWFILFASVGGLVGGLLKVIVGHNAAKEFGGTPVMGAIAGSFIYMGAFKGLTVPFLNIPLSPGYGGIIGVIVAALVFSVIEKNIKKKIPVSMELFLVPFITLLLGGFITIIAIMPLAALLTKGITYILVDVALKAGGIIGGYILAATFLPLVMLGLHQGLTPIHAQLIKEVGYTVLLPILAMAGAGQVGAAVAIFMKTKNKKLKEIIKSGLPIGVLGVGEPLIYGVSLPLFYPFITASLGAGFGGALIAYGTKNVAEIGAVALGPSGLILLPLISNGMWVWYLMGLIVSYIGGFILTYLFGFKTSMEERLK